MRKVYSFGKVAYNGKRKINEVTLEIELRDWNGYPEFTACAKVWNNIHTDIVAGGQMIDDLYNRFAVLRLSVLYKTIMQLWEKYHLHNISDIPEEDKELIDLLVSDKGRKEIEGILKSKKYQQTIYGGRRMTKEECEIETSKAIMEMRNQIAELEKENAELKEQIEKMKCCENCRHYSRTYGDCYSCDLYESCTSLSNWSLSDC